MSRLLDLARGRVELSHGAGGRAMAHLIAEIFHRHFANPWLARADDQAIFPIPDAPPGARLAMTTDSYVVSPIFFPGGDIGSLAVHGTVNDLAMGGARPLYLTAGFILEEGFPLQDLDKIAASMGEAARQAEVQIVAGDTKVVERGKADGVFINTAGLGLVPDGVRLSADQAKPGDVVIVSGSMGDHGVAILSRRQGLAFDTQILSDSAPLHILADRLVRAAGAKLRLMRDPTRGGLAAALNEIAQQSKVGVAAEEAAIPVKPEVAAACELLGLDPLHVANEGKLLAIVAPEAAQAALAALRGHPLGLGAAIIGEIIEDPDRFVRIKSAFGGICVLDWLAGEQLPRIC